MAKEKQSPYKVVSEQLSFYPDIHAEVNPPFEGIFVNSLTLGDDPDPLKRIPVYIFADVSTGEKKYIIKSYSIAKAIEAANKEHGNLNDIVFRFEFLGKTTLESGRSFNQFNTAYCTLEEWEEFNKPESKGKTK